ncbi:hypothetical protein [Natronorubrum halophilum]|uniref:hypothetical protein n=1 Tax=Natronorubrum halophilum TaxID=1702106 RepID=UPI001EE7B213|nr:hypothetical protein [Natronorubrum halophilum]
MVLVAGCSEVTGLLEEEGIETTVQDEDTATFSADAGDELTVTVDLEEVAEADAETNVESDSISFRLDHADNGPIETRSISDSETFDVTIGEGGQHIVIVTNGVARVTIETA